MNNAHTFQRLASYIIDVIIISIICSILTAGIPRSAKYNEASKNVSSIFGEYLDNEIGSEEAIDKLYENKYIVDKESIPQDLIFIVVTLGYFVAFAYYNKGQTVGKKLTRIKVVTIEDKDVSYTQMLVRGLLFSGCIFSIASVITILFIKSSQYFSTIGLIGYAHAIFVICSFIMIAYRKDKRGIHDLICGTKVVEC